MNRTFRRYAEISKVEPQDDGTVKVYGYASSGSVDSDGEVISPAAMKAAIPDYMKFGAVREMHGPSAAGTAIEAKVEEDGRTFFGAHVVDPIAVKKVIAAVYKGFSIGGKVTGRDDVNKSLITGIKLIEVSLVDRPANPDAIFTMVKIEDAEEPVEEPAPAAVEPAPVPTATVVKGISPEDKAAVGKLAEYMNKGAIGARVVLGLAEAAIAKAAAGPRAKVTGALQKGMDSLACFVCILQQLGWLACDTAMEAKWEGDGSGIPGRLRDWLASGVDLFAAMSAEETTEMLTAISAQMEGESAVMAAAKSGQLLKLLNINLPAPGVTPELVTRLEKLVAKVDGPDANPAGEEPLAGDLLKAAIEDTVNKAFQTEVAALKKRIADLEAQPLPAKGPTRVVGKADDNGTGEPGEPAIAPVLNEDGTVNKAATEVKQIHSRSPSAYFRPRA